MKAQSTRCCPDMPPCLSSLLQKPRVNRPVLQQALPGPLLPPQIAAAARGPGEQDRAHPWLRVWPHEARPGVPLPVI